LSVVRIRMLVHAHLHTHVHVCVLIECFFLRTITHVGNGRVIHDNEADQQLVIPDDINNSEQVHYFAKCPFFVTCFPLFANFLYLF